MIQGLYRATLFALYQTVVLGGIVAMPLVLAANRVGVTVPFGRVLETLDAAYEKATLGGDSTL
jgi:hypothetical protein